MGSKSAAKSNRGKIVSTTGTSKTSGKSGKERQTQSDDSDEVKDLSVLRKSVGTSISGLQDVLEVYQTGTQEVRSILARECKIIYECRVCENLFRSIANLISHKRIYCQEVAKPSHPSSLPNGVVPHSGQPASTSEDSSLDIVIVEPEPPGKRQRSKSPERWICNEATPDPDAVAPDDLPKLQYSVPPIRRRKDICSVVEKLTKRASRQNLANATAVAAHYAALTKTPFSLANPMALPKSKALYMESIAETKNAVYQTMLCKASSSVKISHSENSEVIALREFGRSTSKDLDNLTMSESLFSLPSDAFPSFKEPLPRLKSPVPHDLLIKKRVSHLKEITSENEKAVLGPDGVVIPNNTNGPMFPPEVFSGNVSNSEGEEQDEEEDNEEVNVMPKMKPKSSASKDPSSEDREEIVCSICKAKFSTRKTLNHHMKSLHVMFRTYYRCPCCKKVFANNWSVYRHLYKVHRKSTDQVRKLRALIKKKAFRKKILLPLPNSSETPASTESNADNSKEDMAPSDTSVGLSKVSNPSTGKQPVPSASRMPSGPGRSSSPFPPPSEATQYPAISAQHAQVLRKLENIVKEDRRSAESYPEFPGVGQSCPGCGRRFERRAALASHVHSCYKQVLLAAQKAKRATNKQPQPKKATRSGAGVKSGAELEDADKGYQESRESTAKYSVLGNGKKCETIKEEGNTSGSLEGEDAEICLDERQQDAGLIRVSRMQPLNQVSMKSASEFSSSICIAGSSSRSSSDLQLDKIKEEDWDDIERPNSALSNCTHQDSCSPLTLANQTGKQQRIAIQIRRDYVKGDRGSASSSGASPVPYTVVQTSKLEEDPDEEDLIIPTSYSKNPPDGSPESCKQSLNSMVDICSDQAENENLPFSLDDKKPFDGRELVLQLEDILIKGSPENDGTFHLEGGNILTEHSVSSIKEKEDELYEKCEMEGVIGSHGEVKRVFLEGFVVGVADPNSLAVDDEENDKMIEEKAYEPKVEKEVFGGSNPKRTAVVKNKVSTSVMASHSHHRGRPVRNRVKVEREDFIYDLSDMRLSPAKKEDSNPVGSHSGSLPLKRPRRNNVQQQLVSNSSQGSTSSIIENSSSVKQSSSASGGSTLQIYPGKGNVCPTQSQEKAELVGGSSGVHKLSDCRVVIGGLRSGDMKQLSVRRVYTSRKVLSPSNATPVANEVGGEECNSLKKVGRSKECPLGPSNVDAGLFGEMGKGEAPLPKKQMGKSSVLYQSDSLDSTDS
ncbi:hypothetical protein J437_LFUL011225 [Ladona fulva]|uniref:C2H2-type domain-containing protein n=1 Tax=Ladona fulva TaxID=123851 RepID=A0A8K0KCB6_LADFU|nr:hypothetical protein J437_LFUL011225 [Ladona fulva]